MATSSLSSSPLPSLLFILLLLHLARAAWSPLSYGTPLPPPPSSPKLSHFSAEEPYSSLSFPENPVSPVSYSSTSLTNHFNSVKQYLDPHNKARGVVGVPPLVWDDRVAKYARWWANKRRANGDCSLQHSNGPYGENLFWGEGKDYTPDDAVSEWVSEKAFYDYNSNNCVNNEMCGHYTQIVWRDSQKLGCAKVTCNNGEIFITCNYDPPGNYIGEKPY